jgi:hypothetical protein
MVTGLEMLASSLLKLLTCISEENFVGIASNWPLDSANASYVWLVDESGIGRNIHGLSIMAHRASGQACAWGPSFMAYALERKCL